MKLDQTLLTWALIWAGILIGCSTHGPAATEVLFSPTGTTTTFILVRHAERDDTHSHRALTAKGQRRAKDLVKAIGSMGVTAIYSPNRGRNRETVHPLSDHLGIPVKLVDNAELGNTKKFADAFVRNALAQHAGGVVLWVGNKSPVGIWGGNLKEIFQRLGGEGKGPSRYSDLFIITLPDKGQVHIEKSSYGTLAGRFDQ